MDEHIACCGLPCHTCVILLATQESDPEKKHHMRVEIAQHIEQHYGTKLKPEEVADCDGCRSGERLFSKECAIRECVRKRGLANCALCEDYACEKLEQFFNQEPEAKKRLDEIRNKRKNG